MVGSSSTKTVPEELETEEVESILAEDSSCWKLFLRIFRSHQFKDVHVEALYQRYFLRKNQSSLTSLLALLIVVAIVIVILDLIVLESPPPFLKIAVLLSCAVLYTVMEFLLMRSFITNEVCLFFVSYIIMLSFLGLELLVVIGSKPHIASAGVWASIFFTYMTYTFLPLRVLEAMIGGFVLSTAHLLSAGIINADDPFVWKQVSLDIFFL